MTDKFLMYRIRGIEALDKMKDVIIPFYVICYIDKLEITYRDDINVHQIYMTFLDWEHLRKVEEAIAKIRDEEDI